MTTDAEGDVTSGATAQPDRNVQIDGETWIARPSGLGAAGSGGLGLGMLESIEFEFPATPARPVREVLLQRGRFHHLFDAELIALFASSRPATHRRAVEENP